MRRLLSTICLLLAALVVMVSAARVVGQQRPASPLLATLRLTDCVSPCWIGIVPGKTTIEDARERISAVYGKPDEYALTFDGAMPPGLIWASLDHARESFGVIWITIDAQSDN